MFSGTSAFQGHWMMQNNHEKPRRFDWDGSILTKPSGKVNLAVRANLNGKKQSMRLVNARPRAITQSRKFKQFLRTLRRPAASGRRRR